VYICNKKLKTKSGRSLSAESHENEVVLKGEKITVFWHARIDKRNLEPYNNRVGILRLFWTAYVGADL